MFELVPSPVRMMDESAVAEAAAVFALARVDSGIVNLIRRIN